jgi:hypothetical protein
MPSQLDLLLCSTGPCSAPGWAPAGQASQGLKTLAASIFYWRIIVPPQSLVGPQSRTNTYPDINNTARRWCLSQPWRTHSFPMITFGYAEDCWYRQSKPSSSHMEHLGRTPSHSDSVSIFDHIRLIKRTLDLRALHEQHARAALRRFVGGPRSELGSVCVCWWGYLLAGACGPASPVAFL